MAKFIDKSDLENKELQSLSIRRGCSGVCACIGTCQNIVGYVDRIEYEEFISNMVTINDFLTLKCAVNDSN